MFRCRDMFKHYLLAFFLLFSLELFSQGRPQWSQGSSQNFQMPTMSLKGKLLDSESNEGLSFASISIFTKDSILVSGGISDENGKFLLEDLCAEEDSLLFSRIGYQDTLISLDTDYWTVSLTEKSVKLENVIISDEREKISGTQTMSKQSINLEDQVIDRTSSLASIASEIDGVTFISTGSNVERPVIHGLYGNRVLVLNNYIKHGFQNWGDDHAPEINVSSVERISVLKGSSGVRFGPEALGGAIIVEPDPMDLRKPYYLNINSGYQTNGKGSNFSLKTGKGFENFAFNLGLSHMKLGDRHAPSYSLTNSGKEEIGLNAGLHYHLNNFDIKLYYSYVDVNLALLRSSIFHSGNAISRAISSEIPLFIRPFSYDINEPNQLVKHHLTKGTINWWYDEDEKVSLTFGRQLNKRKEFDVRRNADRPIIDLDLITTDIMLEWDHSFSERSDGLIGFHYFNQDNDNNPGTSTTPYIPNYNTNRFSFFIIENLKFRKNLFEFGARVDYEDYNVRGRDISQNIFRDEHSLNNVTFSFGYENKISDSFSFRTNLGSAWRTPNMAELYSFGSHGFKNSFGLLRYYYNEDQELRTDKVILMNESLLSSEKSLKFINQIFSESANIESKKYVTLSGPSFAEDVANELPTAVTLSSKSSMSLELSAALFENTNLKVYRSNDVIGVEIGGALKNVIAIGAGIIDGVGNSESTKAAFITRSLFEIRQFSKILGAKDSTFLGLSGVGDLMLTCYGIQSRNRNLGFMIGKGMKIKSVLKSSNSIAEGYFTSKAFIKLSKKFNQNIHFFMTPVDKNIECFDVFKLKPENDVFYAMSHGVNLSLIHISEPTRPY